MASVDCESIRGVLEGMMNPQELLSYLRFRRLCMGHSKASQSNLLRNFQFIHCSIFFMIVLLVTHPVSVKQDARS